MPPRRPGAPTGSDGDSMAARSASAALLSVAVHEVAVLIPPAALGDLDSFRRLHDPAFHRGAARVPVLPSFETPRADLLVRFDALDLYDVAPFLVGFGAPAADGRALELPVSDGCEALQKLRRLLARGLLGPLADADGAPPAVRIGLFSSDAERELARRAFSTGRAPAPFRASSLALLFEDERGLWHTVRERAL